jgi:acyl-coenzyme A synthetase/AMP-(fatty) acid ligase
VNPAYTVHELVHHLQLTKPKIIIVEPHLLENTLNAAHEVGIPKSCVFAFDIHTPNSSDEIRSWTEFLQHGEADWVKVEDPSSAVAQYATTSGTSGLPKAALLSHSYHVSQGIYRLTDDSLPYVVRRLTPLPPFHVFATPIVPASVRQGHPVYVMRRFDMQSFIDSIREFEITETYLAPPALVAMPQCPLCTKEAVRSLRQIWFGGASLKYANQVPLYALLHPDAKVQPVWGMTEAGWISAGAWPEKHTDNSVGRALPGFQVK